MQVALSESEILGEPPLRLIRGIDFWLAALQAPKLTDYAVGLLTINYI